MQEPGTEKTSPDDLASADRVPSSNSAIPPAQPRVSPKILWLAMAACILLAFALRVYGVNFGLPHLYYWDEPTVVNRAVRFGSGDLNPHFFGYPALYMYVVFVVSLLYFVFGLMTGHLHSPQDFAAQYFIDPSGVYLAARVATALVGTAVVVATFLVGRKYFGTLVGYLGALFLAVSVLHASHSHIAITDVPQSFFIIAACGPIFNVLRHGRRRDYLLAGLLIGLGAATKYLAILLIPSLIVAHLMHTSAAADKGEKPPPWAQRILSPLLLLALAAVFVGFVIGAPFNLLNFHQFMADAAAQRRLSEGRSAQSSVALYLLTVLPADFGWPLFVAAIAGFALLLWRHRRKQILFLIFPILYFLFIARYPKGFSRYMIPEDPFLALMAAYAVAAVFRRLVTKGSFKPAPLAALAVVTALLAALPLYTNLRWDTLMARGPDPRTQALEWADRNIPTGTVVAVQSLFGRTFFNAPVLTETQLETLKKEIPTGPKYKPVRDRIFTTLRQHPVYQEAPFTPETDYNDFAKAGVRYVFISNLNGKSPLIEDLQSRGEVAFQAKPSPESLVGLPPGVLETVPVRPPEITIYRLPPPSGVRLSRTNG